MLNSPIQFARAFALAALALLLIGPQLHAQTTLLVSIPSLHLQKNERIVGFELHVRSGRIAKMPNVPIGWSISIDNDPSWDTSLKGSIIVGAAALDTDSLQHFVIVETEVDSDRPFDLRGTVFASTDFVNVRKISLSAKDFHTEIQGTN
jgi:hypothetical protein